MSEFSENRNIQLAIFGIDESIIAECSVKKLS
jgi:hypothetical protein